MRDLHDQIRIIRSISPVAIGTTGTGKTGKIVDRKGYSSSVEFELGYGTVTATNAAFTVVVKEGDVTGTMTSIADADLIGTEVLRRPRRRAPPRASDVQERDQAPRLSGMKRYVQVDQAQLDHHRDHAGLCRRDPLQSRAGPGRQPVRWTSPAMSRTPSMRRSASRPSST
jgi:hypothetical protein